MRTLLSVVRSRGAMLVGVVAIALTQAACAHPVMVEPSVVVHARLGGPVYGSVVAPIYGPPAVVVAPRPVYVAPPMWGPPQVTVSPWGWGPPTHRHHHRWHGQGRDHGHRHH